LDSLNVNDWVYLGVAEKLNVVLEAMVADTLAVAEVSLVSDSDCWMVSETEDVRVASSVTLSDAVSDAIVVFDSDGEVVGVLLRVSEGEIVPFLVGEVVPVVVKVSSGVRLGLTDLERVAERVGVILAVRLGVRLTDKVFV